ncbi:MAG: choice-of-anchor J domain-containing protein [Bacteroidales bacterium]|nr:choice-of-anchor J domain-containing protein [Bacteroidales bacterium]
MKKSFLFLAILLLGVAGMLHAQYDVQFYDGFENGNLDQWTLVDADGDGHNWEAVTPGFTGIQAYSGDYAAYSFSWSSNVAYTPDNYMISPLVKDAKGIHYYVLVNADYPDHYGIAVSSTGTNPSDFTMVFDETVSGTGWIEREVELPRGTKYFAFRHYESDDNNFLFVDDVVVFGMPMLHSTSDIYVYAYQSLDHPELEKHFARINLQDIETQTVASSYTLDLNGIAATYANGCFWAIINQGLYKATIDHHNKTIGELRLLDLKFCEGDYQEICMAYHPVNGLIYYIAALPGQHSSMLFCFDPNNPSGMSSLTLVGVMDYVPAALAINKAGEAYCVIFDYDGLFRISLTDGSATMVGPTSIAPSYGEGLVFDVETNELIRTTSNQMSGEYSTFIYATDPATGASELIHRLDRCAFVTPILVPHNEAVEDNQAAGIALWPNPAGNTLYLEDVDDATVSVYDHTGRLVLQERYQGRLNVSTLVPGLYVVVAGDRAMRFIKE